MEWKMTKPDALGRLRKMIGFELGREPVVITCAEVLEEAAAEHDAHDCGCGKRSYCPDCEPDLYAAVQFRHQATRLRSVAKEKSDAGE